MPDSYGQGPLTKRKEYELIRSELWTERSSFDAHYRELGEFIRPRRTRFLLTDRNKGDKRSQKIIDSSATFASQTCRAGMHAGLSSPARPWIKLGTPDPGLQEFGRVKEWLDIATKRMLTVFAGSNLYQVMPMIYGDQADFGTGAMGLMEDDDAPDGDLFRCYSYPIGSYAAGVDDRGLVDTFVREWQMTVRQIVRRFGRRVNEATGNVGTEIDWSKFSRAVKSLWDRGSFTSSVDVCWIVAPNDKYDVTQESLRPDKRRFHSCYFEKGQEREDTFLRESGFWEFPVILGRWERTGEDTYGTSCPGMIALGDIKQLQTGERKGSQALEKMINPPLTAPTSVRNQKASLLPGDITYMDVREGQQGVAPIHEVNFAIEKLEVKQEQVRFRIRRAYFEDLFLMLASSDRREITAREIEERHEEKLLALGPVVEGQKDDVHDRIVDRVFAMMTRKGLLPSPPEELQGVKLRIEYISLLAQAQKLVGIAGIERFSTYAVGMAQAFPEIRHKLNIFQLASDHAEAAGINPKSVKSDDEAQAAAQAEQRAIAAQQASEAMQRMAQGANALGNTPMEGDTALNRIIEGTATEVVE